MQGRLVRTMRSVYDVGAGELGFICGMYLLASGYAITVRFSAGCGKNRSYTYTFDYYDALECFYEFAVAA